MDPKIFFVVFLLGIIVLIIYLRLNASKSESSNKSNHDVKVYIDLIKTLSLIDQLLEEKLRLANAGVLLDLGYFDQRIIVFDLIQSGKLAIFGKEFNNAIMEIFNDAEFDLTIVENTSTFVKEQLVKYKNLVK